MTWVSLDQKVLLAAHDEQLAEHGGASGIRDEGLFESALARPQNLASYEDPDAAALAAAYAFGLAKNHPFVDGNKRTALVALESFLVLNGFTLVAEDAACVVAILALAAGELSENELAAWIRQHVRPRGQL
ncbi:MAG: type II toxin-antitoxin system death-on-curing family toxin [Alphaproteobacteria bacterium]|nr:type II toxin-antitoxin system death-on-curing family toxin [Alphaproteobacteria bacterium]